MPSSLLLATFGLAVLTTVLMAWTANLGGQIRHSEITTAGVTSTETATPDDADD
jgi:hypothetical protein